MNPKYLLKLIKTLKTARYIIPIILLTIAILDDGPGGDPIDDDPSEF